MYIINLSRSRLLFEGAGEASWCWSIAWSAYAWVQLRARFLPRKPLGHHPEILVPWFRHGQVQGCYLGILLILPSLMATQVDQLASWSQLWTNALIGEVNVFSQSQLTTDLIQQAMYKKIEQPLLDHHKAKVSWVNVCSLKRRFDWVVSRR